MSEDTPSFKTRITVLEGEGPSQVARDALDKILPILHEVKDLNEVVSMLVALLGTHIVGVHFVYGDGKIVGIDADGSLNLLDNVVNALCKNVSEHIKLHDDIGRGKH